MPTQDDGDNNGAPQQIVPGKQTEGYERVNAGPAAPPPLTEAFLSHVLEPILKKCDKKNSVLNVVEFRTHWNSALSQMMPAQQMENVKQLEQWIQGNGHLRLDPDGKKDKPATLLQPFLEQEQKRMETLQASAQRVNGVKRTSSPP